MHSNPEDIASLDQDDCQLSLSESDQKPAPQKWSICPLIHQAMSQKIKIERQAFVDFILQHQQVVLVLSNPPSFPADLDSARSTLPWVEDVVSPTISELLSSTSTRNSSFLPSNVIIKNQQHHSGYCSSFS